MFSVTTSEVRWFIKGHIPSPIMDWFNKQNGHNEQQPERTDVYLQINNTDTPGIKFREDRFEIKQKITHLGELTSGNVSGNAELWKKWSFESIDNKIPLADITKGEWVEVTKSRKLKKFIFTESGEIEEGFDNFQSDGCNLELTEVTLHQSDEFKSSDEINNLWWTLGLETYGQPDQLFQNLKRTFEHLFTPDFPVALYTQQSFGYQKWLADRFRTN